MKLVRALGCFFCALPLLLPQAMAAPGPNSAGLQIGQAWPSGDIGNDVGGAIAPGIFYEYAASDVFSLYSSVVKSNHDDGKLKLLSTDLGFKANLVYYDKLVPYAEFGMGLYFVDKAVGKETASKSLFGLNLGLGADLDVSDRVFLGMQLSIHQLFNGSVTLPVNGKTELSGRWTGFFLRGGLRF